MSDFSTPLPVPEETIDEHAGGLTWPIMATLSSVSLLIIGVLLSWVLVVDDPYGGQPMVNLPIQTADYDQIDPSRVGVAGVRPSMTPNPLVGLGSSDESQSGTKGEVRSAARPLGLGGVIREEEIEFEKNLFPQAQGQVNPRLTVFPEETIVSRTNTGLIPKRSTDGANAFEQYARPTTFIPEGPKIALVVTGIGLSETLSREAILALPTTTALGISPYGTNLDEFTRLARQNGFELMIEVPMEPFNYPQNDPGPHTLLVDASWDETLTRLHWVLSRVTNYIGVIPGMGARYLANDEALVNLLTYFHENGLAFLDPGHSVRSGASRISPRVSSNENGRFPFRKADFVLHDGTYISDTTKLFNKLEDIARERGLAIGYTRLTRSSLKALTEWTRVLEQRGVTLVPISYALKPNRTNF